MIVFPNAKINIGLRITGDRPDGYHDIETVFYPVGLGDALEFVDSGSPVKKDVLTITGIDPGCQPDDNLVFKAILKLRQKKYFPFLKVHLHKAIPAGAGLGGGSSDAACLLKVINRYYGLNIENGALRDLASELGSDCSFFIEGVPSVASGRGEILTPVNQVLAGYYLVIINPGVGISTEEAYKNCIPEALSASLEQLITRPVIEWKGLILNDFEDYAFRKYPLIGNMKEEMYRSGALFSLMSGSGSSVYGIFSEKPKLSEEIRKFVIWEGMM
jgi:4-diphosphocytidyl-2-C-methyl-D-erythritol kinase